MQVNTSKKFRLAIFASGNGTNAEAIMNFFQHDLKVTVAMLLTNNPKAFALQRATKFNVPTKIFNATQFRESGEVLTWLREAEITHVILAGFLWLVPENILNAFHNKIINIHPALLPKFGGKSMYGARVHETVKAAGEKETGITIHIVNEHFDEGRILFQASCKVGPTDTVEVISEKVHRLEHTHYPSVIGKWVSETT